MCLISVGEKLFPRLTLLQLIDLWSFMINVVNCFRSQCRVYLHRKKKGNWVISRWTGIISKVVRMWTVDKLKASQVEPFWLPLFPQCMPYIAGIVPCIKHLLLERMCFRFYINLPIGKSYLTHYLSNTIA